MAERMVYAHSRNVAGQRHALVDHLRAVASLAADFCRPFGAEQIGCALGLWHDLGKFTPEFQSYLHAAEKAESHLRVPHAIWGALFAYALLAEQRQPWQEIAMPIAAHHTGLRDASLEQQLHRLLRQRA